MPARIPSHTDALVLKVREAGASSGCTPCFGVNARLPRDPGHQVTSAGRGRLAGVLRDLVARGLLSGSRNSAWWPRSGTTLPAAAWQLQGPLRSQSDSHPEALLAVGCAPLLHSSTPDAESVV